MRLGPRAAFRMCLGGGREGRRAPSNRNIGRGGCWAGRAMAGAIRNSFSGTGIISEARRGTAVRLGPRAAFRMCLSGGREGRRAPSK